MLNVNFINIGEIPFEEKSYLHSTQLLRWVNTIKRLTKSIYTYQVNDYKLRAILQDDGKKWKTYAFVYVEESEGDDGKINKILVVNSIIIYRVVQTGKKYDIYNIYQIGCLHKGDGSDEDIEHLEKTIADTILESMKVVSKDRRIIFYENIRETNVLYKVYHDMAKMAAPKPVSVQIVENGKYKDGESKILVLLRVRGTKKFKVFDDIEDAKGFVKLIKATPMTHTTIEYGSKPIFETQDYKIYEGLKSYGELKDIVELHNENMVKQRTVEYFRKIVDRRKSILLVAKNNKGDIVGYILTRPEYSPLVTKGLYDTMNFVGIVVSPQMRGKQVAQTLIFIMEEKAKEMNQFAYIFGHVRFSNKAAQRLYKKLGYSILPIGIYKDTKEVKYRLFKRLGKTDYLRQLNEIKEEIIIGFIIVMGHELIHKIREW